ncbi:MAG: histidine ammonia-lyase [Chitinophagales bacterium]|nr:histidine ammonia-lyase [Chitinophagales bacterium]
MSIHQISAEHLSLEQLGHILNQNLHLELSADSQARIRHCREWLDQELAKGDALHYGINTGFGSLCNIRISPEDISALQHNLVLSHAAGMGDETPPEIVRIMLLLKAQSLSYGFSGVREIVVQRLLDFYNAGIYPVVYELGSLGASGDLAPLAHLSLPLIGEGEVWYEGRRQRADVVLKLHGWEPLTFQAKEALALLNGTQFSSAYAVFILLEARRLRQIADFNAAMGYDAFDCRLSPLDPHIHAARPHAGQIQTAARLRALLEGSTIAQQAKTSVQDPYAFRCVPQVHGASADAIAHIESMLATEINAVTDNPNIFPDAGLIVSGGNFHAQPLALPLDYLALALSELGSIAERRVYQLISGQRNLPPFLTESPGLHSGMMIAQYTAAAIVNQNKTLCTPASADSIISCNGQEDHVSMAANAATKALRVLRNLERLLAIEFMVSAQALSLRKKQSGASSSPQIEAALAAYRNVVPMLADDRYLHPDMETTLAFLKEMRF